MNGSQRFALLAGGALVALTATGCASGTTPSAAAQQPTSRQGSDLQSAPPTSAADVSGISDTAAPEANATSSKPATGSGATGKPSAPPAARKPSTEPGPDNPRPCVSSKINVSLAPRTSSQKASVHVIAFKNTGVACDLGYLPWIEITDGTLDSALVPQIPGGLEGGSVIIGTGQTQYAAIDLDAQSSPKAMTGYTTLDVTPNSTPEAQVDKAPQDIHHVKLPAPATVRTAKQSTYSSDIASAIDGIRYANDQPR